MNRRLRVTNRSSCPSSVDSKATQRRPTVNIFLGVALAATLAGPGFSARVDNPWFPLTPGTTYVYEGNRDGGPGRAVGTVARRTTTIAGAPCAVVLDRLYLRGRLAERTTDWYTQD